ncbi:hypothetical protein BDY24DRAFT_400995 [Mrakia frigida]|uniref:uncharacterized protein n=1 Tax=Mrakia frigida TaxID=29902 RepID=UPI003FCC2167
MSSTSPTATATTTSSTATQTSGGGGGSSATQSSLYLFTFLATLFVLLGVSFSIATRSFILRRRFRARVEAALLRGETFPGMDNYLGRLGYGHIQYDVGNMGQTLGRRPKIARDFGPVPEMWEVQLGDDEDEEDVFRVGRKGKSVGLDLDGLEPLSLRYPSDKSSSNPATPTTPAVNPLLADLPPPPTFFPRRWTGLFSRTPDSRVATPPPTITAAPTIPQEELLASVRGKEAELSVLIKMPDQFEGRKTEEGEVSSVELGWVRVRIEK